MLQCVSTNTGLTSTNAKAIGYANVEGYEGSQSQACPAETHRTAEVVPEPSLGAHCANTLGTPRG